MNISPRKLKTTYRTYVHIEMFTSLDRVLDDTKFSKCVIGFHSHANSLLAEI